MIFRLLFAGRHPFSGRYQGQGDAPSIEDAIRAFRYAYSLRRQTGMHPPPSALSISALPDDVRDMFEFAFDPRTTKGGRPTADSWMRALHNLGSNVRQCGVNRSHWSYSKATLCPWCDIEQSGAVIFGAAGPRPAAYQRPPSQPAQPPQAPRTTQTITRWKVGLGIVGGLIVFGWLASLGNKATLLNNQQVAPPGHMTSLGPLNGQPSSPPAVQVVPLTPPPAQDPPSGPSSNYQPPPTAPTVWSRSPAQPPTPFAVPPPAQVGLPQPSQPVQPSLTIGPGYDCVIAQTQLEKFICSDVQLSKANIERLQPYYVLRHLVGKDGWENLLNEEINFQSQTAWDCEIDSTGVLPQDLTTLKACLSSA